MQLLHMYKHSRRRSCSDSSGRRNENQRQEADAAYGGSVRSGLLKSWGTGQTGSDQWRSESGLALVSRRLSGDTPTEVLQNVPSVGFLSRQHIILPTIGSPDGFIF